MKQMKTWTGLLLFALAVFALDAVQSAYAVDGTWNTTVSGSLWSTAGNWVANTIADGSGATADFSALDIPAATTVNLDSPRTIGNLIFGDTNTATPAAATQVVWTLANNGNAANILTLAGGTPTITVHQLGGNSGSPFGGVVRQAQISAGIAGSSGLIKAGAGELVLTGTNTYSGGTILNAGTLRVGGNALGAGTVTINGGWFSGNGSTTLSQNNPQIWNENFSVGLLDLNFGTGPVTIAKPLTLTVYHSVTVGGAVTGPGGLNALDITHVTPGGTNSGLRFSNAGPITLRPGGQTVTVIGNGIWATQIDGVIVDGGNGYSLTKAGPGPLVLTAANTYSGDTTISQGTLRIDNKLTLQNSALDTSGAGVLNLNAGAGAYTFGGLKGSKNLASVITTNLANMTTLTLNPQSGTADYSGAIANGAMALTKTGAGTQVLSGANTYTGATTVSAGTLLVNGSLDAASAVTVGSGGKLGGTGTIGGPVTVNGILAPGASIESLATGMLTFNSGSTFQYELNTSVLNGDLTLVSGDLNLNGTVTLDLIEAPAGTLAPGSKLTLINYSGSWNNGTFNGYADDSLFTLGANQWQINYNDTAGGSNFSGEQTLANFVTLTVATGAAVIPEPSTLTLLGLGVIGLIGYLWRRRR